MRFNMDYSNMFEWLIWFILALILYFSASE